MPRNQGSNSKSSSSSKNLLSKTQHKLNTNILQQAKAQVKQNRQGSNSKVEGANDMMSDQADKNNTLDET